MNTKPQNLFSTRAFKSGSYTAAISAIAIVICIALNLIFSALPEGLRIVDLSGTGLFSLSEESINIAKGLQTDVALYYLAETGSEDIAVQTLLNKYAQTSPKIITQSKDPVLYPTFASKYSADGAQTGSIIVVSGDKSKLISATDLYVQTPNYTTYQYDTSFAAESALTSAISYVTRTDLPKLYSLSGHGASTLSQSVTSALSHKNYENAEVNILSEGAVPDDASAVILYSPEKDLSATELAALREYLNGGGSLLLANDFKADANFVNLNSLLGEYGLSGEAGIVVEGNSAQHVKNYPHYLLPTLAASDITAPLSSNGSYVIMPLSFSIKVAESLPEGVTVTPLLTSSINSYLKASGYEAQTLEKESADISGPFNVAVLSEKTSGEVGGKLVWFASSGILDEVSDSLVNGSNTDLFINTISYLSGAKEDISISAKPITTPVVTIPAQTVTLLTALTLVIIPVVLIFCGFIIWLKRRRA